VDQFANSDFYSASAQVLPVLFLAAAVEFQVLVTNEDHLKDAAGGLARFNLYFNLVLLAGFVLTVGIGEFAALQALSEQRERSATHEFVIGSLMACGITVLGAPMATMLETADRLRGSGGVGYPIVAWMLFVATLALPVYAGVRLVESL
jgi:hypothetical protein